MLEVRREKSIALLLMLKINTFDVFHGFVYFDGIPFGARDTFNMNRNNQNDCANTQQLTQFCEMVNLIAGDELNIAARMNKPIIRPLRQM